MFQLHVYKKSNFRGLINDWTISMQHPTEWPIKDHNTAQEQKWSLSYFLFECVSTRFFSRHILLLSKNPKSDIYQSAKSKKPITAVVKSIAEGLLQLPISTVSPSWRWKIVEVEPS